MDAFMHIETPFERYVYFLAFKHDHSETQEYLEFFNDYCETTPTWTGPDGDNTDVLHPGIFHIYTPIYFMFFVKLTLLELFLFQDMRGSLSNIHTITT